MRASILAVGLLAALGCGRTPLLNLPEGAAGGGGVRILGPHAGMGGTGGVGGVGGRPPPLRGCGNGVVEDGEQCDGRPGLRCADVGLGDGRLTCDPGSCQFDVSGCSAIPPTCPPGASNSLPPACLTALCACDPMLLAVCDADCFAQLECALKACGPDRLDDRCALAACPGSGEGQAIALKLQSCIRGNPLCGGNVVPPPPQCGNGIVDVFEGCEGRDLRGQSCRSVGFDGGTLRCDRRSCQLDTSGCTFDQPFCGNGMVDEMEACDGAALAGQSCRTLGLGRGTLRCTAACSFDTRDCRLCGDGRLQDGEACDGTRLAGQSCVSLGFSGGKLGCARDCSFDVQGCALCGDGVIGPGENCDGADLGGASCTSLGLGMGTLSCSHSSCHYLTSNCDSGSLCGNGVAEADEQCDGMDLASHDCASLGLGFETGTLACNPGTCRYNTSDCERSTGSVCLNRCIDASCSSILSTCEATPGCSDVRACLDNCREDPSLNCIVRCASGSTGAAAVAIVASDCVADCAFECR